MPACSATVKPLASPDSLPNFCSFGHISGRQVAEKLADPAYRFDDRLAAVGIGKTQIAFAKLAKARACHRSHTRLVEKLALERADIEARACDVGESVERAARPRAAKPREIVQCCDDRLAALGEGGDHAADGLARALQRGDPGELGGSVDAGMAVDREPFGQ